jgi:hypothetical protein
MDGRMAAIMLLYRALSFRRKLLHRFVRPCGIKVSYEMTKRGTKDSYGMTKRDAKVSYGMTFFCAISTPFASPF